MSSSRVATYIRLSNEDNDKINKLDYSESIKNQRSLLIDYINSNSDFMLYDEYIDENLSGAGTYRPEFERLIEDCKNRKIDIVLCKSQSRFSRDIEIVEKYINNKFKEWNIRFISLIDNIDTEKFDNKKMRQINGLVNEWYLEDLSNNIRSALNAKMKQGEFISPFAAFGYELSKENNNKLIIDPFASEVVKIIYNLYLKGYGFNKIATYLNDNKIPSPSCYKYKKGIRLNINSNKPRTKILWNQNAIKQILTNELYIGNLIQGKRTTISYKNHKVISKPTDTWIKVNNTHEAIIDKDIFNKVQMAIKERKKTIKSTGSVHIFSGKVFCKECGYYMRKKNSTKHEYLVCSNCYTGCTNKSSIRYDILENIVLSYINKLIKTFYDNVFLKKEYHKKEINIFNKKISLLTKQKNIIINKITKNQDYLKNLYEDKINGIITPNQFKELIANYMCDDEVLKKDLIDINNKIIYYKQRLKIKDNLEFDEFLPFDKLNKVIVDEFVNKIYINKTIQNKNTRDIEIKWNF